MIYKIIFQILLFQKFIIENCHFCRHGLGIIGSSFSIKAQWNQMKRTVCADLLLMGIQDQHDLYPISKVFINIHDTVKGRHLFTNEIINHWKTKRKES